jgi:hypothetical protein
LLSEKNNNMKTTTTRNYSIFISDKLNRVITDKDATRLKRLRASMQKYGFLPFPILVRRSGEKLIVIDGQHRLMVAQELGLPVVFVETDRADIIISECAAAQSSWNIHDYVASHAAQGNKAYQDLLSFAKEHAMPINRAASLLRGEGALNGNHRDAVKDGSFAVRDRPYADRVARLCAVVSRHADWSSSNNSIGALSRFVRVSQFDDDQFMKRVAAHPHLLRKQPTLQMFSEMYEAVYNHASRARIPLAFMANELASQRGDVGATRRAVKAK